jgi:hypothetical protein
VVAAGLNHCRSSRRLAKHPAPSPTLPRFAGEGAPAPRLADAGVPPAIDSKCRLEAGGPSRIFLTGTGVEDTLLLKSDSSDAALVARELHSRAGLVVGKRWGSRPYPPPSCPPPGPNPPPPRGEGRSGSPAILKAAERGSLSRGSF